MSEFKKGGFGGNRGGGDRGFGNRPSFGGGKPNFNRGGDRGNRPTQMHSAVCDECHKSCEVPFRPSGDKPIYCNDCFGSKRESSNDRGSRNFQPRRDDRREDRRPEIRQDISKGNVDYKVYFDAVNAKLDKLIVLMSKNSSPVVKMEKDIAHVVKDAKKEIKVVTKAIAPVKKEVKKDLKKIVAVSKKAINKVVLKKK